MSCCIFSVLNYLSVGDFSSCTVLMCYFFRITAFSSWLFLCCTHVTPFFVLHCFHVVPFLHSFHVAPFLVLVSFHVAPFLHIFSSSTLFHVAIFLCYFFFHLYFDLFFVLLFSLLFPHCTFFTLHSFMSHSFHVAHFPWPHFSCCTFFIIHFTRAWKFLLY